MARRALIVFLRAISFQAVSAQNIEIKKSCCSHIKFGFLFGTSFRGWFLSTRRVWCTPEKRAGGSRHRQDASEWHEISGISSNNLGAIRAKINRSNAFKCNGGEKVAQNSTSRENSSNTIIYCILNNFLSERSVCNTALFSI